MSDKRHLSPIILRLHTGTAGLKSRRQPIYLRIYKRAANPARGGRLVGGESNRKEGDGSHAVIRLL